MRQNGRDEKLFGVVAGRRTEGSEMGDDDDDRSCSQNEKERAGRGAEPRPFMAIPFLLYLSTEGGKAKEGRRITIVICFEMGGGRVPLGLTPRRVA